MTQSLPMCFVYVQDHPFSTINWDVDKLWGHRNAPRRYSRRQSFRSPNLFPRRGQLFASGTRPQNIAIMDLIEPLIDAIVCGEEGLVQMFITMGINLATACDLRGRGVLHWSASSEQGEQLVPFLISKGAKINMQDHDGFTPLHVYAITGRTYGLTALLHSGADPNIPSFKNNLTPLHVALQHNRSETANLLLCYGAKLILSSSGTSPIPIQTLAQGRPLMSDGYNNRPGVASSAPVPGTVNQSMSHSPPMPLGPMES